MLVRPACFVHSITTRLVPYRTLCTSSIQHARSAGDSPSAPRKARFAATGPHKLTLEHFVLRSKSIKLYRDFIRATRNIPNPDARRETVSWLRDEHFEGPSGLKAEFDLVSVLVEEDAERRGSKADKYER